MDERFAQQAQDTYRINQIQMASKEQLLVITYDIGIRSCSAAERAMETSDVEQINTNLKRAQAVVRELMITLNLEQGGEVAVSLMKLYDYMYYQLVDANVKKEMEPVQRVRKMMEELKATWVEAITKLKTDAADKQPAASPPSGGTNFAY
ncbi:flagellar export chaperone FliS [Synergistales bacterium]|nr:flagellar export chaperone FliS [Synergistales bacterium]GHV54968.1 flagellar export chaperone FliS [Synergistales bacterium]